MFFECQADGAGLAFVLPLEPLIALMEVGAVAVIWAVWDGWLVLKFAQLAF